MPADRSHRKQGKGGNKTSAVIEAGTTTKLNKKIRDITRLLDKKKESLPANVIIEKERELKALKVELANAKLKIKIKDLSKKYHMVRFFEKKKALRRYNQVKNKLAELTNNNDSDDKSEIKKTKKKLKHCEEDLIYIVNFPRTEKYIALFPTEESDNTKNNERRQFYKHKFQEMVENSTIPIGLEDILKGVTLESKGFNPVVHEVQDTAEIDAMEILTSTGKSNNNNEDVRNDNAENEEDDFFE